MKFCYELIFMKDLFYLYIYLSEYLYYHKER